MICSMVASNPSSFLAGKARTWSICTCKMFELCPKRYYIRRSATFAKRRPWRRRKRPWWRWMFSEVSDEEDFLSLNSGDGDDGVDMGVDSKATEKEKFEAWRQKAEAVVELREAQEDARNAEGRAWEDWIGSPDSSADHGWGGAESVVPPEIPDDPVEIVKEKGLIEALRETWDGNYDDMLFEDRVFKYASTSSAKFVALLVVIPWIVDFMVHDYILMPFLDRYVKTVPLAAELLDVRRPQKLKMIEDLKIEKARYRFEAEIGKAPPLSEDELWWEVRKKAIEMRDEWRLENRKAFANIWSDMVYGTVLFALLYFNQNKVSLLKFTGYKMLNNVSDAGKAFLIILITDIFLGYHSESGWRTMAEVISEHYGFESDEAAITIFVSVVPVVVDALVKLWLFKFLPRLSPNVAEILDEMRRH